MPVAATPVAVPTSFDTCARPWLPIGATTIGNGSVEPKIVTLRSGLSTPERKCGSIGVASMRAQILALGVFGARAALDVVEAAFGQDLLRFDLELGGVDDAEALDLLAALIGDLIVARLDVGAGVARGQLLGLRQGRGRCGCRCDDRAGQEKIASLDVHGVLPALRDARRDVVARDRLDVRRAGQLHDDGEIVAQIFEHALRAEMAAERQAVEHRPPAGDDVGAERERAEHVRAAP